MSVVQCPYCKHDVDVTEEMLLAEHFSCPICPGDIHPGDLPETMQTLRRLLSKNKQSGGSDPA